MKLLKHAFPLMLFTLIGCSGNSDIDLKNQTAESLYTNGRQQLSNGNYSDAAEIFSKVEDLFPYSSKASVSQILAAYCHFLNSNYLDATRELDIFMRYHSSHPLMPYAMYLRSMCIYMQVSSVGRDPRIAQDAKQAFIELMNRYPNSIYFEDCKRKVFILDCILAAHEMDIGRFYQKRSNSLSAIGRYNIVISKFRYTNQVPEACYRTIECCLAEGLKQEALDFYSILKNNYSDNVWKKKADSLMAINKDFKNK
ncbi:MAG: outer membrane protein assembly factor BamD [Alphaproteobacteria bacterium]|nr:outer membrane protein assembly factor BamD [Alphaproteobacteria bacterium]